MKVSVRFMTRSGQYIQFIARQRTHYWVSFKRRSGKTMNFYCGVPKRYNAV